MHKTTAGHTKKMRLEKLLREADKHKFSAKTLDIRMAVSYSDPQQSFSGNGKIRILKDSIIWGSLNFMGIPMVKFYITPGNIRYYNKIDRTYYDGNFGLLKQKLGLPFDFNNLQNLLTGDLITNVAPENTGLQILPGKFVLTPQNTFVKKMSLTPFYKMLSGLFYYPSQGQIRLLYDDYQKNGPQNIPGGFEINTGEKYIKVDYKNINVDKVLRFPFKIPSNYQKLQF